MQTKTSRIPARRAAAKIQRKNVAEARAVDNRPEALAQRKPEDETAEAAVAQRKEVSTAIVQRTKLGETTPSDGPDPEAAEIEWWRGNPYILDDRGTWRRVSREMVDNQRGERGNDHNVTVGLLRTGVRKTYTKGASRLFKITGQNKFLQVIYKYGMVITSYYMSDSAAKRAVLGNRATDTAWEGTKKNLPVV